MKPNFLSLPPCKRYKRMLRLNHVFATNAKVLNAPFSIISYGSVSYGFNRRNRGHLDDMDFFLVVPKESSVEDFIETVEKVFISKIQVVRAHLLELFKGGCDICRMYGHVDGVKISFRVMRHDVFAAICSPSGSVSPMRNIAALGQSRIIVDREWSFRLKRYVRITYPHEYQSLEGETVLMVVHSVFSKRRTRLGALGRKLLMARATYEADGQDIASLLLKLWEIFVDHSLRFHPDLAAAEIVNSIIRSERFSNAFRERLCATVTSIVGKRSSPAVA